MAFFFNNINELCKFSRNLDIHRYHIKCQHCFQSTFLVSHDFIYKHRAGGLTETVGKRLFCSNRGSKNGCGRTFRLSIANAIPQMQYSCTEVAVFLIALFSHSGIAQAYRLATGNIEPRHAYRWLDKLQAQMLLMRQIAQSHPASSPPNHYSSRRLTLLLSTIDILFSFIGDDFCSQFQLRHQQQWM